MNGDALARAVHRFVESYLSTVPPDRKSAYVQSVTPLEVLFPGDTAPTRVRATAGSYAPTVGDSCVVERVGSTWIAVYSIEEV